MCDVVRAVSVCNTQASLLQSAYEDESDLEASVQVVWAVVKMWGLG